MSATAFRLADLEADRTALLQMNVEYIDWLFEEVRKVSGLTAREILGEEVEQYVSNVVEKVCGERPPLGAFYLVEQADGVVAMGGLRRCDVGIAELKRVYVRPHCRGQGLGEVVTRRLLADARAFGYRAVRLDTLPFMRSAQALYESLGFVDCPPHPSEMPEVFRAHIRYMVLAL